mgnify:CR=1
FGANRERELRLSSVRRSHYLPYQIAHPGLLLFSDHTCLEHMTGNRAGGHADSFCQFCGPIAQTRGSKPES